MDTKTYHLDSSKLPSFLVIGLKHGLPSAAKVLALGIRLGTFDNAMVDESDADLTVEIDTIGLAHDSFRGNADDDAGSIDNVRSIGDILARLQKRRAKDGLEGLFGRDDAHSFYRRAADDDASNPFAHLDSLKDLLARARAEKPKGDLDGLFASLKGGAGSSDEAFVAAMQQLGEASMAINQGVASAVGEAAAIFAGIKPAVQLSFNAGWGVDKGAELKLGIEQGNAHFEVSGVDGEASFKVHAQAAKTPVGIATELVLLTSKGKRVITLNFEDFTAEPETAKAADGEVAADAATA